MISFPKEVITNDLERFSQSMKESYELDNIEVMFEENNQKAKIGFVFNKQGKKFKAYIPRTKLDNGEYEVKNNESWILETPNKVVDNYLLTIGHFMDEVDKELK